MSVRSTSPIMRDSPVQVIPMEDTNNQNPKRSPRAWSPSDDGPMKRNNGKSSKKECQIVWIIYSNIVNTYKSAVGLSLQHTYHS